MSRALRVLATIAGLGIVTVVGLHIMTSQRSIDALSSEVERLRIAQAKPAPAARTVVMVERPIAEKASSPEVPSPPGLPEPGEDAPVDPDEQRLRNEALHAQLTDLVRKTFDDDSLDAAWANSAKQLVQTEFSDEELRSLALDVECRSKLCKIGLTAADGEVAERGLRRLLEKSPWPAQSIATFNREQGHGVIFLTREGVKLPSLDSGALP